MERKINNRENGEGAIVLVADDVLIQTTTDVICGELVEESGGISVVHLKVLLCETSSGRTNGTIYLDGTALHGRETKKYRGMTLWAQGLRREH